MIIKNMLKVLSQTKIHQHIFTPDIKYQANNISAFTIGLTGFMAYILGSLYYNEICTSKQTNTGHKMNRV